MDAELWQHQVNLWKTRKKELGITFDELSEQTNISIRQLYYLFGGKAKNPGVGTVHRVNTALGIATTENGTRTEEITEEEKQLVSLIAELTDEEVKELSNFVDYIISKREK